MKPSIRLQLVSFAVCLVLLVGGAISTATIYLGQRRIIRQYEENAREIALLLSTLVRSDVYLQDVGALRRRLRLAQVNPDIRGIQVMDAQGLTLDRYVRGEADVPTPAPEARPGPVPADWTARMDGGRLTLRGPITMPDGTRVGSLLVWFSLEAAHQEARHAFLTGLYVTLACLGLGTLLSVALAVRWSRPLRVLARAAGQIGRGRLDTRVQVGRGDEVGQLGEAINQMAASLQATTVSRAQVDRIIGSMSESLITLSPEGTITSANPATLDLLGYTEEELVGQPITLILPEDETFTGSHREALFARGAVRLLERTYRAKDGRNIPILLSASVMPDIDAGPDGVVCVAQDITERTRMEAALRRHAATLEERVQERTQELKAANARLAAASQHKSELLANMSHELRTPLNSILGFSRILQQQAGGLLDAKQERYLAQIEQSGRHLLQLVNDLLDLSKVEAGKLGLERVSLDTSRALEEISVLAQGLATSKGHTIRVEIEPDLPALYADPVRLKQICLNLLSNAVKFTPEGGTITVTARKAVGGRGEGRERAAAEPNRFPPPASPLPEYVEISVSDTGVGIRPEDLPRLFQEFVQLETTRGQNHEGTGLGLAMTKRLVELHGGRIRADSDGVGKGSVFRVWLPVREAGAGRGPG